MAIVVAVLGAAGVGLRWWAPRVPWGVPLLLVPLVGNWLARRGPATWGRLFAAWPPAYQLVLIFAATAALAVAAIAVTRWSGLALGLVAFVFASWTGPFGEVIFGFGDRLLAIVLGVAVLGVGILWLRGRQPERA